ncbi:MAG: MmgE/PrpD family protein, partial [Vulcanimicrobiaceae bacterium]
LRRRVDAASAAFCNAALSDALDYQDTLFGHPSATIVPATLAVGELVGATGREIVAAIACAYDISVRIGMAIEPSPERGREVAVHFAWLVFGAAAAAAKLLRLSPAQSLDAFGYAGASSSLPIWITKWQRPLHWMKNNMQDQARAGVMGAFAARAGVRGPRTILDSDLGFWKMVGSDRYDSTRLHDRLGSRYLILETHFKPFPACRWTHTIIEAAQRLRDEHALASTDIEDVLVAISEETTEWFFDPHPRTLVDAEFSLPYVVAAALCGITPGPQWYRPETLRDPALLQVAGRVRVVPLSSIDANTALRGKLPCEITIRLKGGREVHAAHAGPLGSPERPLNRAALQEKFIRQAEPALGLQGAGEIWDIGRALPKVSNIRDWTALLEAEPYS